ncbi:hypothetical protein H6F43_02330 [Leptolyngbya sp. FACHB-36]|nr:hypothetical protein [Leptolyngbya sp. FACHB-36]
MWSLTQNPHNGILLSSGQDETINVWNLAAGTSLKTLRCPRPYEGAVMTGTMGLTEAQKITLQALGTTEARVH